MSELRWDEWINNEEYKQRLSSVEKHLRQKCEEEKEPDFYTPHDAGHCLGVEKIVKALITKSEARDKISDLEKFILFGAVWTHDLGMLKSVSPGFFSENNKEGEYSSPVVRERHDEISAWYLSSHFRAILSIESDKKLESATVDSSLQNYAYTINVISKYHRMKNDINECPKEKYLKGEIIRTRFLAALLRLGDTLHVDSTRFDRKLFDVLQIGQFDRAARLHWLKSFVVSNIYLDNKNETILINIDLPEDINKKTTGDGETDWKEAIRNLENRIVNDILDDMLSVREIFRENEICPYNLAKTNITFIPGYPIKYIEAVKGVINDLGIVVFPNTSRIIETAIDSVLSLCTKKYDSAGQFDEQMDQLLAYLDIILKDRSSHIGLGKVVEAAKLALQKYHPVDELTNIKKAQILKWQQSIKTELEEIRREREQKKSKLYGLCKRDWLQNYSDIIVFSYSEMVTKFLYEYGKVHPDWKENVEINVLECSGKRRLESDNSIEYDDGLYYASQLSIRGFKNINLLPDTSFASFASLNKQGPKSDKSLVIFGVNGIDADTKACIHTSGHLMIAIVAKHFKIPVWIIADSFKKGKIRWETMDAALERQTSWLTGQKELLKDIGQKNIKLVNYRHDLIPEDLISALITDDTHLNPDTQTQSGNK